MIRHHGRHCICSTCQEMDCNVKSIEEYTTENLIEEICKRDDVSETFTPAGTRVIYIKSKHGGLMVVEE